VIVALPRQYLYRESVAELMALCEAVGVDVTIVSDLFQMRRARPYLHDLLGVPGVTLASYPHRSLWALATKRAIDIVGAVAGILIAGPLFLLVALAIKLDSPGPVFFVQRRCGLRGRTFPFIKFRTMYTDAEAQLEVLRVHNEVTGPVFKMKKDPRVTRVGRVLRKYSIDELPQLWNVLVGHMSLVGPRPPIPGEVSQYDLAVRRRLSVRPGLTCLWQVRGRSLIPFEDWMRLDLEYIDRWSLMLDFRILLLTIPAVLKAQGAS
jgi:exopolysaccharide biosynthesis polyprenyl glycosylphosphotransferase